MGCVGTYHPNNLLHLTVLSFFSPSRRETGDDLNFVLKLGFLKMGIIKVPISLCCCEHVVKLCSYTVSGT